MRLENAEAMHAAHPDTFQIPVDLERHVLWSGCGVKLGFLPPDDDAGGERMWVLVEERLDDGTYVGSLKSRPFDPEGMGVTQDDRVAFGPEHVLDVVAPADKAVS